jgi:hypothetical protein
MVEEHTVKVQVRPLRAIAVFCLAFSLASSAPAAIIDFASTFAPGNWSVTFSGGPPETTLNVVGSDAIPFPGGAARETLVQITIPAGPSFFLSFDWDYVTTDIAGPSFDPAGFYLNAVPVQLSDNGGSNSQNGSELSILVNPGDVFAFYVNASDDCCGAATFTVDNFVAQETPEPSTVGMFLAGLSLLGIGRYRRRG